MRLVSLRVEDFMGVELVLITPSRNLVQITGKNGQGKTAILVALFSVLFGRKYLPSDPVRHGAHEARITLDLGEVIGRLVIPAAGEPKLTVEAPSGARFPSPQKMLSSLADAAGFDVGEFVHMPPKQKYETLARIMGLSDMLAELAAAHQVDFENRTVINRDVKQLQALVDTVEWDGVPVARVDVADVMAEIREAEARNGRAQSIKAFRSHWFGEATRHALEADRLEAEAAKLLDRADAARSQSSEAEVKANSETEIGAIDTAPLQQRIVDAQTINERARKIDEHVKLREQLAKARADSEALTARIERRQAEKAAVIASAPVPVPGIGFSEDGVTLDGVPFEQASTAQKLLVSARIGMSANPELRLMTIRDASMFDSESLEKLDELAEAENYIVLAERATDGQPIDRKVGFVISAGRLVDVEAAA